VPAGAQPWHEAERAYFESDTAGSSLSTVVLLEGLPVFRLLLFFIAVIVGLVMLMAYLLDIPIAFPKVTF
jgi:hypothetical protein